MTLGVRSLKAYSFRCCGCAWLSFCLSLSLRMLVLEPTCRIVRKPRAYRPCEADLRVNEPLDNYSPWLMPRRAEMSSPSLVLLKLQIQEQKVYYCFKLPGSRVIFMSSNFSFWQSCFFKTFI